MNLWIDQVCKERGELGRASRAKGIAWLRNRGIRKRDFVYAVNLIAWDVKFEWVVLESLRRERRLTEWI